MKKTTFIILCLEGAILSFNLAASAALVPVIAKDFGISEFITGRIIWFYMVPYGVTALFYGPLARLFDARRIELICIFCFSLANLFAGISRNILALFTARFFMGIFGASVVPLALILISRQVESSKRGRSVGLFFSGTFIASLIGLFLSGIISWRFIYLIPALLGFILLVHMYFYLPSFKEEKAVISVNYLTAIKDKKIITVFSYIFIISLLYHSIQQWLGVYFSQRYGFSQFLISMLITLTSLSGIFGEAIGGWFSDTFGRLKTVNLGIILMIISVFLLIFKMPLLTLIVLMTIWGLGWTFNHAGISTHLTDLPREFLNEAASLNSSVRFLSGGIGAALSGLLMQRSFNLGFFSFGLSLVLLLIFTRNLLVIK